jgi:DNA polymerase III subunit delta
MPAADSAKPFVFICGADDFLVGRLGKARHDELAAAIEDEFSRETINGFVNTVDETEAAIARFRDSAQTVSMFGGRRLVWFKDVNFLADSRTGNSETVKTAVEHLQSILAAVNPAEVAVLITATPVDRRKSFYKWCEKTADFAFIGAATPEDAMQALATTALAEARALGVTIEPPALQLLLARSGANTRFLVSEVNKLAAHALPSEALTKAGGPSAATAKTPGGAFIITEADVANLTPNLAEGDFFEATDAFFRGDLRATLAALDRHFFAGESARPVLSSLQKRNRLLIQIRSLATGGRLPDKFAIERAAGVHGRHFVGATEKSDTNIFSQNPWYLGKLAATCKAWTLKQHIDHQIAFAEAFETLISRPKEEAVILRELAIKCLS